MVCEHVSTQTPFCAPTLHSGLHRLFCQPHWLGHLKAQAPGMYSLQGLNHAYPDRLLPFPRPGTFYQVCGVLANLSSLVLHIFKVVVVGIPRLRIQVGPWPRHDSP